MGHPVLLRTALLLACLPGIAGAQTIYKCVVKGKPTTFQNEPCSSVQHQAKSIDYTPDQVPAYRPDVHARPYAQRSASGSAATIPIARAQSACDQARRHRDEVLGKNNQGGNYDVRVRLNDMVHRACN